MKARARVSAQTEGSRRARAQTSGNATIREAVMRRRSRRNTVARALPRGEQALGVARRRSGARFFGGELLPLGSCAHRRLAAPGERVIRRAVEPRGDDRTGCGDRVREGLTRHVAHRRARHAQPRHANLWVRAHIAREGDAPARSGRALSKPHDPPATSPTTASLTRHRLLPRSPQC